MKKKTTAKSNELVTATVRRLTADKLTDVAGGNDPIPGKYIVVFKDGVGSN